MKYRDILGFPKKEKFNKRKKSSLTEKLEKRFGKLNEWSEQDTGPKRWSKSYNDDKHDGLTEFEKTQVDETLPVMARQWKGLDKAEKNYTKAVLDLGKAVGRVDQKKARDVVGLYRNLSASMKKFKELLSKEILDKLQ